MEAVNEVKDRLAHTCPNDCFDMMIARAHRPRQAGKPRIRFDGYSAPPPQVEGKRGIVIDGVARSDVNVESVARSAEAICEKNILKALRIRDEGCAGSQAYLSKSYSACSVRTASSV